MPYAASLSIRIGIQIVDRSLLTLSVTKITPLTFSPCRPPRYACTCVHASAIARTHADISLDTHISLGFDRFVCRRACNRIVIIIILRTGFSSEVPLRERQTHRAVRNPAEWVRGKRQFTGGTWNLRETKMLVSVRTCLERASVRDRLPVLARIPSRNLLRAAQKSAFISLTRRRSFAYISSLQFPALWIIIFPFASSQILLQPRTSYFCRLHYVLVFRIVSPWSRSALLRAWFLILLLPFCFHATLFRCLYAYPLSFTSPYSLSFPLRFVSATRQFDIFFFSQHGQSFFSSLYFRISALPPTDHLSLPRLFFISFYTLHAKLLYLPTARICMRESNLGRYGKHIVQRERWRNVNQLCRVHPLVKPKPSGFIAPICLAVL